MSKHIDLNEIIDIMREKLDNGGTVTFTPSGNSMYPMLRDGEDTVVLTKPKGRLHLFDLPLYVRKDGSYVMHRVVKFDPDGSYVMCGDNQYVNEHGVKDEDIIAVVTAFYRKGKPYTTQSFSYRIYLNVWFYTRFFRHCFSAGKSRTIRLLEQIKRK